MFNFFITNLLKIYLLVLVIGFFIGIIREYITPERTRKLLSGKNLLLGNLISSFIAVITPVEEFSIIPVFIGLLETGVHPSIAFTYLLTAPITNEVAFALFFSLFGYKIAFLYYGLGIAIGLLGGILIGSLKINNYIKISNLKTETVPNIEEKRNFKDALKSAMRNSLKFFKGFWLYIFIGIALATIIQGYVPNGLIVDYIGLNNPFAIPMAVLLVILLYVNIAMVLPILIIFVDQGFPLGTIFAFTMATTATSIPELLIMKKAVKLPLIIIYMSFLLILIILSGYLVNFTFRPE
ncbi:MAG: hypothetical protein A2Y25_06280 [Candidatus Melainabacteria bacterium GWF2_37_15]|nr:MAG: hypothetical protein A2Y25_06280 [Candidatus Melainabacteria bacterium GWF2_37_15]